MVLGAKLSVGTKSRVWTFILSVISTASPRWHLVPHVGQTRARSEPELDWGHSSAEAQGHGSESTEHEKVVSEAPGVCEVP